MGTREGHAAVVVVVVVLNGAEGTQDTRHHARAAAVPHGAAGEADVGAAAGAGWLGHCRS